MALPIRRTRKSMPATPTDEFGLLPLRDEVNRLLDDFFSGWSLSTRLRTPHEFIPSIDIAETDNEIKVSAELPGMTQDDIDVEIDEVALTIRGEKKQLLREDDSNRYWCESTYGKFVREIPLPKPINTDKVNAAFQNGRLVVTMTKAEEEAHKRRKIEIKAA